ncbi:MAG: metallophosphoesterase [Abditibacteriota bacterium]|nr:metallophosphoesterase [Abditibacteriota bacterium]
MKKTFFAFLLLFAAALAVFAGEPSFIEEGKEAAKKADLAFLWASDVHYQPQDNHGSSRELIESIVEAANGMGVAFSAVTGDLVHGHYPRNIYLENLSDVRSFLDGALAPVLPVMGNHDDNRYFVYKRVEKGDGFLDMNETVPKEDFYRTILKGHEDEFVRDPKNPYGGWYYKDFTKAKVRVIMLNSIDMPYIPAGRFKYYGGYSEAQLQWLANKALKFSKKGWGVIVMCHIDYGSQTIGNWDMPQNSEIVEGILEAFAKKEAGTFYSQVEGMEAKVKYNFRNNRSCEFIGSFAGHKHKNLSEYVNGTPHVLISNVFREGTGGFDLVLIDRKKRTVVTKRCIGGAAEPSLDRAFVY